MSNRSFVMIIDPGLNSVEKNDQAILFPDSGEYVRAINNLVRLGLDGPLGSQVPDEIIFHLYAYEILERIRDLAKNSDAKVAILPLWPDSLFEAAGLVTHSLAEIRAIMPRVKKIIYVKRTKEHLKKEACRVLGGIRFDIDAYFTAMDKTASREGWEIRE